MLSLCDHLLPAICAGAGKTFGVFCVINLGIFAIAGFLGFTATSMAMRTFRYHTFASYAFILQYFVTQLCSGWCTITLKCRQLKLSMPLPMPVNYYCSCCFPHAAYPLHSFCWFVNRNV